MPDKEIGHLWRGKSMARLGMSVKKTRFFWVYHFAGVFLILAAIVLAPFWANTSVFFANWGTRAVDIMISCGIFMYLFLFLAKKVKSSPNQTILILTVVEFVLLFVVALGGILSQFAILNIQGPSQIVALALWLRGSIEVVRAYYYRRDVAISYPIWYLLIAIGMISVGAYLFARPLIKTSTLLIIICAVALAMGIILIFTGTRAKPKKS